MDNKLDHPQLILHPFVLLALAIVLTLLLGWVRPLPFFTNLPAQILGSVLFIGGFLFGFPAFQAMLRARTTLDPLRPSTVLVENGSFRLTRNPMYLGMLVSFAGLFIFLRDAWFLVTLPLLLWLLTVCVIIPEERYLQQNFHEDYARFAARVPRWI